MALLAGAVCAETKDVNLVQETQQFEQGSKVAIVVGVKSYDQRLNGFRPLDYAGEDAKQVAAVLKNLGYQVELLVDGQASPNVILNRIRQKGKLPGIQNGTMLFYFSGHGFAVGHDNYLAAWDSVAEDLQDSGLGISKVVDAIRSTQVRRAVLLVDACRNDPRPGRKGGSDSYMDVDTGEGVQIFYSTRFGDVSWENDAFKHGVFSYFLMQGLSGQGAQNGLVTFNSLANYVEGEVSRWTDSNMSQTQQPFRRSDGDFYGDFVLARLGETVKSPVIEINEEVHVEKQQSNERSIYDNAFATLLQEPKEAIPEFRSFLEKFPKSSLAASAHYWIGEALYAEKDFQSAIQEFLIVLKDYKDSDKAADAALKMGYSFYELKDWDKARKTLEDVQRFFPENKEVVALAGEKLAKIKNLSPDSGKKSKGLSDRALYDDAFATLLQEPKEAIPEFRNFLEKFPKSSLAASAHYWIGEALYAEKDFQSAIQEFLIVLKDYKDSDKAADAALKMGYSFYELKDWDEARKTLEDVQRFFPENKEVIKLAKEKLQIITEQSKK
ncbi:tol-pal system protein YbgF [Thiothrix nivea]|uniref:tol-pal system protein YbgF n=1 Tax=Thiothrix nivea TaxID=1031 RepID=UPI00030F057C|nr:tol-pal system protein YbgF [Thiothrix nivea]